MIDTKELRKLAKHALSWGFLCDDLDCSCRESKRDYQDAITPEVALELLDTIDCLTAERDKCGSGPGCLYKDALIDSLTADRNSWQKQASDRVDDAVRFAAERDALAKDAEIWRTQCERPNV